jgi:hypothetical protein
MGNVLASELALAALADALHAGEFTEGKAP